MSAERQNVGLLQTGPKIEDSATLNPRLRHLATCFAAAFSLAPACAPAASTLIVNNCGDSGTGSLRGQIGAAGPGDTIDLSTAQLSCSLITLTSGEIAFSQSDLTLVGPTARTVTITTNVNHRLLHHEGTGLLDVQNLTFSSGYYHNTAGNAVGGCIASNGSVKLTGSVVSGCTAYTYSGTFASGGGIYASNEVRLYGSRIVGNLAYAFNHVARGGGVCAYQLRANYTTISTNSARGGGVGFGGGSYTTGGAVLTYSTVDSNAAADAAGIAVSSACASCVFIISNSTISGNQASSSGGGVGAFGATGLEIDNSTIAFNIASNCCAGVDSNTLTVVRSSILARNSDTQGGFADLYEGPSGSWSSFNSLVQSYSKAPTMGTPLTVDPQLTPLANHGGPTRTHALLATSPAVDQGSASLGVNSDQRGLGFPRVVGANADIGAYERQANDDEIFYSGFN